MAYADANMTNRKWGAGASVLALEVGIAWAVIAGLTMTISRPVPTRVETYQVTPETPKPPVTVPPPTSHPIDVAPVRPLIDPVDLGPTTLPTFAPDNTIVGGDGGGIDIPRPSPTPPPVPTFAPKAARPLGYTGGWVTTNDYPTIGLQREQEGSTRYRLSIDAAGKVNSCTVTTSSGHSELDSTTCAVLTRRARFTPATDESGAKVPGSFSGTVTWRLPQD